MPFDGRDFPQRPPRRPTASDNTVSIIILAVAISLLVLPVSLDGLVDIIRYLRRD